MRSLANYTDSLINYFRGLHRGEFVGRDECYVWAKKQGKNGHVCLKIELKGDKDNKEEQVTHLFKVLGRATTFWRANNSIEPGFERIYTYYSEVSIDGNSLYFSQIKPSEVLDYKRSLYSIRTFPNKRTALDYHSNVDIENTRGKRLYDFIIGFTTYLYQQGFRANTLERDFVRYEPPKIEVNLPLTKLGSVFIYDNRLNKNQSIQFYQELLTHYFPTLIFELVDQLDSKDNRPVLLIQDTNKADFDPENGLLSDYDDPYQEIYRRYPDIPKR